jgi:Fe-S-cluster containining protein
VVIELPLIQAKLEIGVIDIAKDTIQVTQKNSIHFKCKSSTDCCVKPDISVTDFDIKRIEDKGYELDQIIEKAVPVLRFAKNFDAERNYWVKKKPFDGSCTFLEGDKCSIHEFKPFACRIFPFQIVFVNDFVYKVIIHSSNLCSSVKAVGSREANNADILNKIKEVVKEEDNYRLQYFERYGRG